MAKDTKQHNGIEYARGVAGKYLFRVREALCRWTRRRPDPLAPRRCAEARSRLERASPSPRTRRKARNPAICCATAAASATQLLHDLCRNPARFAQQNTTEAAVFEKKRTWVREQLQVLEARGLVRRSKDPAGRRPDITVLCDRCDGEPFDDPGATATATDGYLTISGAVISSPLFRDWGAPEVVAYLCAMTADRFRPSPTPRTLRKGNTARLSHLVPPSRDWFNNTNPNFSRPPGHIAYRFSTTTIQRGLRALRDQGLITTKRTAFNPHTGHRFTSGPRNIYVNHFADLRQAEIINLDTYRAAS